MEEAGEPHVAAGVPGDLGATRTHIRMAPVPRLSRYEA